MTTTIPPGRLRVLLAVLALTQEKGYPPTMRWEWVGGVRLRGGRVVWSLPAGGILAAIHEGGRIGPLA